MAVIQTTVFTVKRETNLSRHGSGTLILCISPTYDDISVLKSDFDFTLCYLSNGAPFIEFSAVLAELLV